MRKLTFRFREPSGAGELAELLRLRYRLVQASILKSFTTPNEAAIELDPFDLRALHYGLYLLEEGAAERPVGYIRVVGAEQSKWAADLARTARDHGLADRLAADPGCTFPLETYAPVEEMNATFWPQIPAGERICEASRLVVDPEFRAFHLARFMTECCLAHHFWNGIFDRFLLSCPTEQGAAYKVFFQLKDMVRPRPISTRRIPLASFLTVGKSDLSNGFRLKFEPMTTGMRRLGFVDKRVEVGETVLAATH